MMKITKQNKTFYIKAYDKVNKSIVAMRIDFGTEEGNEEFIGEIYFNNPNKPNEEGWVQFLYETKERSLKELRRDDYSKIVEITKEEFEKYSPNNEGWISVKE